MGLMWFTRKASPIPDTLAKSLRTIRSEAPEFWEVLEKLNMEFDQQPSGFDDGVICAWTVERQAKQAPCSIRVVDSFGGGLSKEVRETAALNNQIITEIEAKMTLTLQVTDTDEAFRLESCQMRNEKDLRKALMRVAQLEDTRPVFKCGVHEVLKLLASTLKELFAVFEQEETLKEAMVRNLWTVLRPNLSERKFEKVTDQPWGCSSQSGDSQVEKFLD